MAKMTQKIDFNDLTLLGRKVRPVKKNLFVSIASGSPNRPPQPGSTQPFLQTEMVLSY